MVLLSLRHVYTFSFHLPRVAKTYGTSPSPFFPLQPFLHFPRYLSLCQQLEVFFYSSHEFCSNCEAELFFKAVMNQMLLVVEEKSCAEISSLLADKPNALGLNLSFSLH